MTQSRIWLSFGVVFMLAPGLFAQSPPSITSSATPSAAENQNAVIDVDANDPEGDTENGGGLTYSLTGGVDQALFAIDADSGILTFVGAPDFEAPGDSGADNNYDLEITVTDSEPLTGTQAMVVTVTNVNEAPSITSSAAFSAAENQTSAGDVDSSDPDGETEGGGGLTYSLTGGADQALFAIDTNSGALSFAAAPDFEAPSDAGADNDYDVEVTVTDAGGLTNAQAIVVSVVSVNEGPAITSAAAFTADENQTSAGDVDSTDPDGETENGGGLTYSLTGGADQALFAIDTNSGALSFAAAPDFEAPSDAGADNDYDVEVTVTDAGGLTDAQAIVVSVVSVNEGPAITSAAAFTADENQTSAGDVDSTDPDGETENGGGLTYSLTGGADQALFAIDADSGALSFVAAPDFEAPSDSGADNDYDVEVTVTDAGGLTDAQAIVVSVVSVNEAPSIASPAAFSAAENQISAGDVDSNDPDGETENGGGLTYSLTGGVDQALFAIDTDSGALSFIAAPDFEAPGDAGADNNYEVDVTVTDAGGLTGSQSIVVTVTDVNEAPSIVSAAAFSANENQTAGGDVDSTDPDGETENGGGLTYSLSGGADQALFAVDTDTGSLTFLAAPDFEAPADDGADNNYDLDVTVTDAAGLTGSQSIVVTVLDLNEQPEAIDDAATTLEDLAVAIDVSLNDLDVDSNLDPATANVGCGTCSSTTSGVLTNNGDGSFSYSPNPDFNGADGFVYEICDDGTPDSNVLCDTASVTITVNAVNDEPSFSVGNNQTIDEDAPAQTVPGWATAISAGPADEAAQILTFNVVDNTNPGLFAAGPAIDSAGTLTYTTKADTSGSASVTIELMDDGGTADGGNDTSPTQIFSVTVNDINDAPSFTSGGNVVQEAGTGEQMVPWATNVSVGPINESTQAPTFVVVSDDCSAQPLLSAGPFVDPDGSLRYTPVDATTGSCTITVKLTDDGGTAGGGIDESPEVTFTLELVTASRPVADPDKVTTDGGNPLGITLTGSDPDNQTPLSFQVIEPVTDQDTGEIISDSGPFRGTLDTTTPTTNGDGVSADVVYTPNAPFISNAAIIATQSIVLEKFADVLSGDVVVNNAGGSLSLERSTTTPSGFDVKADSIDAGNSAIINGTSFCNSGDLSPCDATLPLPALDPEADPLPAFLVGDPDDSNDQNLSGTTTLTPGLYGDVDISQNADVTFAPGKYSVRSLTTGKKVDLHFSGPTEIMVAGRLVTGSNNAVGAAGAADQVVFYVAGSDSGGDPAIEIGFNNADFHATLYAPNGTIEVGSDSALSGGLIAANVNVGSKSTVSLDSAFGEAPDQFAFEVTDTSNLVSDVAVVEINADTACRDSAGQIVAIAAFDDALGTEGAALVQVTLTACESSDAPVTFDLVQDGTNGTLTGLPVGAVTPPYEVVVTYTPTDPVPNERDSFIFSVSNGVSTAQATVEINEPPCASVEASTASNSVATNQGDPLTVTLSGCDPNNETLTFATDPAAGGAFIDCASCAISAPVAITDNRPGFSSANVVITHSEVVSTATSFDYSVTSSSGSDLSTVAIEVNPINLPPVANDDAFSGNLGGVVTGNVLANDTDVNQDALTATLVSGPTHSSNFTLNPDGTFVYTHNGTANFTDSFVYDASDGTFTDTATVSLSIVAATITVTVSKAGPGAAEGTIFTDPAGIDCGPVCSAGFMTTGNIRLDAVAGSGFVFAFWSGDADCVDGELTPLSDRTCIANFDVDSTPPPSGDPILVTIQKTGSGSGTVLSDPAGIDCGATCSTIVTGTPRIGLTAIAASGSVFTGFSGGPGNDCADSELDAVVDTTCSAIFTAVDQTLTLEFFGAGGGTVISTPSGLSCSSDCSAAFETNATVTVSARPDSGDPNDVTFAGACTPDPQFPNKATVVMTADATCTVTFN